MKLVKYDIFEKFKISAAYQNEGDDDDDDEEAMRGGERERETQVTLSALFATSSALAALSNQHRHV